MFCPLRNQQFKGVYNQDQYEDELCAPECGWWDQVLEQCAILSIKTALQTIATEQKRANK